MVCWMLDVLCCLDLLVGVFFFFFFERWLTCGLLYMYRLRCSPMHAGGAGKDTNERALELS